MGMILKLTLLLSLVLGQRTLLSGQSDSVEQIEQIARRIDADTGLKVREFDANNVFNKAFDGGGVIKIYFDQNGIKKFHQEIGVSVGRLTKIIYFDQGRPVKIIDREENFNWRDDGTGWDYTKLNQIFQASIYIFDWEIDNNITVTQGARNFSEGACSVFEYPVELGQKLLKE